ncbi:hypothetical protein BDY21DRAFT_342188 [Lineolata rhizophorae]|uniref:Uncharacterized protein n=1 Tax=Lineolata rhizophorae TaxID=578093 RepID=A0A6A6P2S4_9PEZI|nr:hypothetical protein BDY21DRAFT_342188 [Lineolata rhizophorae]
MHAKGPSIQSILSALELLLQAFPSHFPGAARDRLSNPWPDATQLPASLARLPSFPGRLYALYLHIRAYIRLHAYHP